MKTTIRVIETVLEVLYGYFMTGLCVAATFHIADVSWAIYDAEDLVIAIIFVTTGILAAWIGTSHIWDAVENLVWKHQVKYRGFIG